MYFPRDYNHLVRYRPGKVIGEIYELEANPWSINIKKHACILRLMGVDDDQISE